jgi:hypothetical protein
MGIDMSHENVIKEYEKIKLEYTNHAKEAMELIQISDEQVKMVIHYGESTGEKLYSEGEERFLAKMEIGEATICVEYSPVGKDAYKVYTAYAYKLKVKV